MPKQVPKVGNRAHAKSCTPEVDKEFAAWSAACSLARGERTSMFRITRADHATNSVLTLEGDLAGDCVEAVERCCCQAITRGVPVNLVLKEVSNIDIPGRALLEKLPAMGVRLRGAGVYTAYLLRSIRRGEPHALRKARS